MADYAALIQEYLSMEKAAMDQIDQNAITQMIELIVQAYEKENTIFVFGNGGSGSTASHFQSDFNKGVSEFSALKFQFCCLNDNMATILAIANDIGFSEIFRFQLVGRLKAGDLIIAISGSGNSNNVINAVKYAKACGNQVIGLTGFDGGRLKKLCDVSINVPIDNMQITEDIHLAINHLIMSILSKTLSEEAAS